MDIKRILTTLLGLPLVVLVLILGNKYVVDVAFAIVSAISLHEYFNSIKGKFKPVIWMGYLASLMIAFIHIVPYDFGLKLIAIIIPTFIGIMFLKIILSNMKTNVNDIAMTLFGICYITLFILFIPIIHGLENGKVLVGYVLITAWGTDIFAYITGKWIGKHKFCSISPNKTIEGCIGGIVGACIISLIYTYIINISLGLNIGYVYILIISVILSIIGQIGDLSASSIKRYVGIKDFSKLIPGHGGMLDRIDSVIFIAPFAYILFSIL